MLVSFFYFLHGCLCLESKMSFVGAYVICVYLVYLLLVPMSFVVCVLMFSIYQFMSFLVFINIFFLLLQNLLCSFLMFFLSMFVLTTSMFLGSLLFIVFEFWVECHVCEKCQVSCVFILCDSFVLCLSNVRFHVCCFCVSQKLDVYCI